MTLANRKICQSCGMPIIDEHDMSTNIDGTQNSVYCHFCYEKGSFTNPKLTLKKQVNKLVETAKLKLNLSEKNAFDLANTTLSDLKRWRE